MEPHNFADTGRILTKPVSIERPGRDLSIGSGFFKIRPIPTKLRGPKGNQSKRLQFWGVTNELAGWVSYFEFVLSDSLKSIVPKVLLSLRWNFGFNYAFIAPQKLQILPARFQ